MKSFLFTPVVMLALVLFSACNTKNSDPAHEETMPSNAVSVQKDSAIVSNASSDNVIQHFICPNHCQGSGGAAEGKCPVCGTEYVHNEAFHKGTSLPEPAMKIDPVTHMAVPTHTEAQNASGAYHFICPNGDPGGSGVAGKCSKCGADLVHNQAFHSN